MKRGIIYCYTNKVNGKCYVGQTINETARKSKHLSEALNCGSNFPFHCAIRKYGIDNFEYGILEECSIEDIDNAETKWITELNSVDEGYNCNYGGKGNKGFKMTDEQKKNVTESKMGNKNPMFNRDFSDEHRRRMSESHRGKTGAKCHNSKGVIKMDINGVFIADYCSLREAGLSNKIDPSDLGKAIRQGKTKGGYLWQYRNL